MNLVERIRIQTLNLTVCNTDLRRLTDPEVRDYVKRLRRIREEGLWRVGRDWPASEHHRLQYEAEWAAHRLALAVGVDSRLGRDYGREPRIDPADVRTLMTYLRLADGQEVQR